MALICRCSGHKFFERAEVKDVIAYLQLAENPSYTRMCTFDRRQMKLNPLQPPLLES